MFLPYSLNSKLRMNKPGAWFMNRPTIKSATWGPKPSWQGSTARFVLDLWLVVFCLLTPTLAFSQAIVTDVLDAADEGDPFDAAIDVRYEFSSYSSLLVREQPCYQGSDADCPSGSTVLLRRELKSERTVHRMVISPRIGLYRDLELSADLPIVLMDQTNLDFASGVNPQNSTVYRENQPNSSLFTVPFNGTQRSGFGDMRIGLKYSPLNFQRDETEPTWVLGVHYTAPTGKLKTATSDGVGEGTHTLELFTTISRRATPWLEPYFNFHGAFRFPASETLFEDRGLTQTLVSPGNSLGIQLGTELIPWEDNASDARLEFDIGFRADYHFEGREYTQLFEALGNSACNSNPDCLLTTYTRELKENPAQSLQLGHTDGITDVEQYGIYSTWIGLHYQPIRYFQLGAKFMYSRQTAHYLTNADPGKDLDGNGPVQEDGQEGNEYSPVYLEGIDSPAGDPASAPNATRFRAQNADSFHVMIHLTGKF